MAELTTVARPYAKAAFEYARGAGELAGWSSMLALAAAVVANADFNQYISRPMLSANEQADALFKVCGDRLDAAGRNFISNVASHKRLAALPAISSLFEGLRAEAEGAVDVSVTSAFALTAEQTQQLGQVLAQKLSRQVNVTSTTDASLIGGTIIRAGDMVIDASVRGQLGKLNAALNT